MNIFTQMFDALDAAIYKVRDDIDSSLEESLRRKFPSETSLAEARFSDFTLYIVTPPTIEKTSDVNEYKFFVKETYGFGWPSDIHLTIEDEIWEEIND